MGFHPVASHRIEEHLYLVPRERLHLLAAGSWRLHGRGDVPRDQTVVCGLFEGLAERAVNVQHGSGGDSGIQLFSVEAAHVTGREDLEPDPAERRAQMHSDDTLVPLVGLLAHGISNGVRQSAG
jgi:hypothetical protein